ncbi:MAG: hypothetical protein AB7K63_10240 [Vicinamibacterales bacterium]
MKRLFSAAPRHAAPYLLLLALAVAGCSRTVDVTQALEITEVQTGWYDMGIVDGQNKLVPSISLRLQNTDQDTVGGVQLNAIFRRVGEADGWGEHFVQAIPRDGIGPGATTNPIVLRSTLGYTGTQSRLEMLQNAQFVDATVDIFGKQGRGGWVKMGEFTIDRQLLTE